MLFGWKLLERAWKSGVGDEKRKEKDGKQIEAFMPVTRASEAFLIGSPRDWYCGEWANGLYCQKLVVM